MASDPLEELDALRRRVRDLELSINASRGVSPRVPATCQTFLSRADILRYGRQMLVRGVGAPTQAALRALRVLIVGAGGLGCPAALYLAGAGVGHLSIIDSDIVELSNIHRQVAHAESFVGVSKAESLRDALRRLNSGIEIVAHCVRFNHENASELVSASDIVVDCSDNAATRYLVNDACVILRKVLVTGAALGTNGQLSVHNSAGPCYRCLHPVPPPQVVMGSCADNGVLGPVTGVIGALQAMEVIKCAAATASTSTACDVGPAGAGFGDLHTQETLVFESLAQRMLVFDAADARVRTVSLRHKSQDCAVCGANPFIRSMKERCVVILCVCVCVCAVLVVGELAVAPFFDH
jgi:adenylyltransferase and sulfurtransferase